MEQNAEAVQMKEVSNKIDKVLSMILTLQGQVTIMQDQNNQRFDAIERRLDSIEGNHKEFKQEVNERFDKQEADHKEFNMCLVKLLDNEFEKRDKAISKQSKQIKKIQAKPTLISCIKNGIKKFVPKQN